MWNGQSYECYRSAEGRGDSCQHTGQEEDETAHPTGVHAKVAGVTVADEECVEWLYHQQDDDERKCC